MQFFKKFTKSASSANSPRDESIKYRWIINQQLAVGPIPNATIYQQLKAANFKAVLSLCAETEGDLPIEVTQDFRWHRLALPDSHYEESMPVEQLAQAVAIVHSAISQNMPIYVHCLAGMERSPTVCTAYLCLHKNMEVWEALNWVKQSNSRTSLNSSQVQVLQALVKQMKQGESGMAR
jgi:atypical dual specificity phosphatase